MSPNLVHLAQMWTGLLVEPLANAVIDDSSMQPNLDAISEFAFKKILNLKTNAESKNEICIWKKRDCM